MIKIPSLSNHKRETSGMRPAALSGSRCDLLWKQHGKDGETTWSWKSFKKSTKHPAVASLILRTLHTVSFLVITKGSLPAHCVIWGAADVQTYLTGQELTTVIFWGVSTGWPTAFTAHAGNHPACHRMAQELTHTIRSGHTLA